jgi:hypothetical protein
LEPELSACAETQARRQYEQMLNKLLDKGEERDLGEKLELLRLFIESTDFSELRNKYEKHLLEGRGVKFILYLVAGKPRYEMEIV